MKITPKLNSIKVSIDGGKFVFSASTKFANSQLVRVGDAKHENGEATKLESEKPAIEKNFLSDLFLDLSLKTGENNAVCFVLDDTKKDEEYKLNIDKKIEISASSRNGFLWGLSSLKQMVFQNLKDGRAEIPFCTICDKPRFSYRGYMLDVSRHFFGVDTLKKLLNAMWLLKLNVFHLHLSDNQGFRLKIDSLPKLHEVGSIRNQTRGDGKEVKGYYAKEDIAEIVRYADERGIEVIPEIDMPGHVVAILAAYPKLSCTGEPIAVGEHFGIVKKTLCAGKESVYEFLFKLLDEVADMFPSKYIHIGGDEAPKFQWEECEDCKNTVKRNGLRDMEDLQGYFTNRIIDHLKTIGKTPIVWNESLNSGILDNGAVCQYWQDGKIPRRVFAAADRGRKTIISKFSPYYLDYPYGMFSLRKTYLFEPLMDGFSTAGVQNILGVESPLWTEYVDSENRLFYQTFPRLIAVAESGWSDSEKDFDEFADRVNFLGGLLSKIGIKGASIEESMPNFVKGSLKVVKFFANAFDKELIKSAINAKKAKETKRTE